MKKLALAAVLAAITTTPAAAYDQPAIAIGLGAYQAMDDQIIGVKAEYRFSDLESVPNLSPIAGFEVDADGALYGYGGILYDWNVANRWYIVPSFAVGLYEEGDSVDLGGILEFRSTIEVDYALTPTSRLGASLSHKSNASIYDKNPGTEEILAVYSFQY